MKKFLLLPLLILVAACTTACTVDLSSLEQAQSDFERQLMVSEVICNTESGGNNVVDTVFVNVAYQCVAVNPDGAQITYGGQPFSVSGWYVIPDSAAIITIQGSITPRYPVQFEVHAGGTKNTDQFKRLQAVIP